MVFALSVHNLNIRPHTDQRNLGLQNCDLYLTSYVQVDIFHFQVGYDAGDGTTYYSVPGSMTDQIYSIINATNIGTRGRWLFRTDTQGIVLNISYN